MAVEEDPFGEYLTQDQAPVDAGTNDAGFQLKLLLESSQRQEELLGKMCSLLLGMDEKLGQVTASQERLDGQLQQMGDNPNFSGTGGGGRDRGMSDTGRGSITAPPGKTGPTREEEATKLAAERARIEEENKARARELAQKKELAEKRAKEEAER